MLARVFSCLPSFGMVWLNDKCLSQSFMSYTLFSEIVSVEVVLPLALSKSSMSAPLLVVFIVSFARRGLHAFDEEAEACLFSALQ